MKLGPRYKIAKRLGPIFEKTQTQRFALSKERSAKNKKGRRGGSDYSRQLIEKQKLRLIYSLTERQFSSYVKKALESGENPSQNLFESLETRIDSIAYRMGIAQSRRAARQIAAHGHLTVDGVRVTVPSFRVAPGSVIAVRDGSKSSALFQGLEEKMKDHKPPAWLTVDDSNLSATLTSLPAWGAQDSIVDFGAVFEYYTR